MCPVEISSFTNEEGASRSKELTVYASKDYGLRNKENYNKFTEKRNSVVVKI